MGVNLLTEFSDKDLRKEEGKNRTLFITVLWVVFLLFVTVVFFIVEGYFNTQKLQLEASVENYKAQIMELDEVSAKYYTLAYKLGVLKYIRASGYLPNPVVDYIKSMTPEGVEISAYTFYGDGGFEVSCKAADFLTLVRLWDKLIQDKNRLNTMQLQSMSLEENDKEEKTGRVTFVLKAELNLDKLLQAENAETQGQEQGTTTE